MLYVISLILIFSFPITNRNTITKLWVVYILRVYKDKNEEALLRLEIVYLILRSSMSEGEEWRIKPKRQLQNHNFPNKEKSRLYIEDAEDKLLMLSPAFLDPKKCD